jgi:hypothetical protein
LAKDSTDLKKTSIDLEEKAIEFSEYGYLAQELEKVFPDLVSQDSEGYYSVNYIGLIPIIIESLKDQKQQVEYQKQIITKQQEQIDELTELLYLSQGKEDNPGPAKLKNGGDDVSYTTELPEITNNGSGASLQQNIPNPFNQNTEIRFYIPENIITAKLCIYNLQGFQIKQITVTQRGDGSQIIYGSEFSPGIYLYTLIADGKEVDTKRMILM